MNVSEFLSIQAADSWNPTFRHQQQKWLGKTLASLEPVAGMLARSYLETARRVDYVQANHELREAAKSLHRQDLNLAWPDDELSDWCNRRAEKAAPLLRKAEETNSAETMLGITAAGLAMMSRYGMPLPDVDALGPMGFLKRLADARWWRLQVRRFQAREVETLAILLRRVRKGREIYCSDETVRRRSAQKHRNRKYLENTEAENQEGQRYTLAELADLSVSNPKIRRGELMLRVRGFDEVAQLLGHVREFWTMTAPSRFHRWTTVGNVVRENKNWDGSTPKQAQQWLSKVWARIRAELSRIGVRLYGFRVVEAHHDGTPHWHAAVFYKPEFDDGSSTVDAVRGIVRRHAVKGTQKSDALERGAHEHRCDFKTIDPAKGDAAGYLAKYITKAIAAEDAGALVQQDLYGYDLGDSARRVEAWASCHRIRQFQQIGGPSVSAWRELRRAMSGDVTQADLFDAPMPVQRAAEAADEGDWLAFVLLMGGPTVKRADQLVRLGYWNEFNAETGEVIGSVFNRYGEPAEAALFGLTYEGGEKAILTRVHTWTIHRPGEEKPEVETAPDLERNTSRAMREADAGSEWKPWAFDILGIDAGGFGLGFRFSGAPPGAPLEFCQ